jgi:hypothetical protein
MVLGESPKHIASFCELVATAWTVPGFNELTLTVICPTDWQLAVVVPVTEYNVEELGFAVTVWPWVVFKEVPGDQR